MLEIEKNGKKLLVWHLPVGDFFEVADSVHKNLP